MKCPLLLLGCYICDKEVSAKHEECLKEKCAWWRKEYPACCIYSIERAMWTIAAELGTIQARMPHLEQFKRA